MIIRTAVNAGLHVVAGVVMGGLAMLAAARAAKKGSKRMAGKARPSQAASSDTVPPTAS